MFITITKKKIVLILTLIIFIGLCITVLLKIQPNDKNIAANAFLKDFVILIDPGHGGVDGGATDNGIIEKDLNLKVAEKLKNIIEENGGNAILTRNNDISLANPNRNDNTSDKKSDLKTRKDLIKETNANIFVSIHMNKFTQEKYHGAQVFYSGANPDSQKLGESIQKSVINTLNDGNTRVAKKADNSIYILKNTPVPSVIVECGFISNKDEAEKLKTEEHQNNIANAIYLGICDYYKSTNN